MKKQQNTPLSCEECGSRCCRYIATEIDKPSCKRDYDHIRWYLLHGGVNVFIDHHNAWFIEFETACSSLAPNGRCLAYNDRPRLCAQHGENGDTCEFHADTLPYKCIFRTAAEFETYLCKQGIEWRWRR